MLIDMKRLLAITLMALLSWALLAQETTSEARLMVAETDGATGYYLALGAPDRIPGAYIVFDQFAQTCIFLGNSPSDALKSIDDIIAMFGKSSGTSADFPARLAVGETFIAYGKSSCVVKSRFLQDKRLIFFYEHDAYVTETYLSRETAKSVRLTIESLNISPTR